MYIKPDYEVLPELRSDDGEDTFQALYTPQNGIKIEITNADMGPDVAVFHLEMEQAKVLAEALLRWVEHNHGYPATVYD